MSDMTLKKWDRFFVKAEGVLTDRKWLEIIGATAADDMLDNFHNQSDPDGNPWAALAQSSWATRSLNRSGERVAKTETFRSSISKSKILINSGRLMRSLTYRTVGNREVHVGTNVQYGYWHNFGTGTHGKRGSKYPIKPKRARALKLGGVQSAFGMNITSWAFRKSVMHPGVKARQFVGLGDRGRRRIMSELGPGIYNDLRGLGGEVTE